MKKDARIVETLNWLAEWLGNGFVVVDHWESDLCAIGLAAPQKPNRLVYISTFNWPEGEYQVDLHDAALPNSDLPYRLISQHPHSKRDELLRLVVQHLEIPVQSLTPSSSGVWFPTAKMKNRIQTEHKPKKKLNAAQKRELKAADFQLFTQEYERKAQRGTEPNDRKYSRDTEKQVKTTKPEQLDKLLRDGEDEE